MMTMLLAVASNIVAYAYDFTRMHDFEEGGVYYNILSADERTCEVTYGNCAAGGYSGDVVIPATVTHGGIAYDVTAIGESAFYGCPELTAVSIPDCVTSIGKGAFYECVKLVPMALPGGVTAIPDYAFRGCTSLTSVTIPKGVTSVGRCAFYNCSELVHVVIPKGVTSINDFTFYGCM